MWRLEEKMADFLELVGAAIALYIGGFGMILYFQPLWWVGAILLVFAVIVTIAIFGSK
jgi:hypothetical protein